MLLNDQGRNVNGGQKSEVMNHFADLLASFQAIKLNFDSLFCLFARIKMRFSNL